MADKLCPMTQLQDNCKTQECAWFDETGGKCSMPLIRQELSNLNAIVSRIEENSK